MGKKFLIINNVNEKSGAPIALFEFLKEFDCYEISIREDTKYKAYKSDFVGIKSSHKMAYILGILKIIFSFALYKNSKNKIIICNTILTAPIGLLLKLSGKKIIFWIHENDKKSMLYKILFKLSVFSSFKIITPSKSPFVNIINPKKDWSVIPNFINKSYFIENKKSLVKDFTKFKDQINVLFLGGKRKTKGYPLYRKILDLSRKSNRYLNIKFSDNSTKILNPPIQYSHYDFIIILTDNLLWQETFGLVGAEAALNGCIPLYTDNFAYSEIWKDFNDTLFIKERKAELILERIISLSKNKNELLNLKHSIQSKALIEFDRKSIKKKWIELLKN